eukprot:1976749-Pyramimonas_sp.AAC.1
MRSGGGMSWVRHLMFRRTAMRLVDKLYAWLHVPSVDPTARPWLPIPVIDEPVSYTHLRAHETGAYL